MKPLSPHLPLTAGMLAAVRSFSGLLFAALLVTGGNLSAAPDIKATQTDAFPVYPDGRAREGDTITYSTVISNVGADAATGVQFTNPTPGNTTDIAGSVTISPLAFPDTYTTGINSSTVVVPAASGVLVNDTGLPLPTAIASSGSTLPASSGTYSLAADGSFTFTPQAGFQGAATFTYTVTNANSPDDNTTVTIMVDDAPTVTSVTPVNNAAGVPQNSDITVTFSEPVNVTGNWFKIVGSTSGTRNPADTVVTGGPTTFTINPNSNFASTETVTFTVNAAGVTDQDAFDPPDNMASDFTSSFTVASNTPPAITDSKPASVTMSEDGSPTAFSLTLNATDADGDTITWSVSSPASHGTATASGTGPSKAIGYTPTANYNGTDSFTVQVADGNGGTDTIVVNVTINAVNDAPAITDTKPAAVTMSEDGSPTAFSLTLNATDADNDTITWSISGAASHGTATATGTGASMSIGYTPTANYNGTDSFTVQVSDGNGGTDTIIVNVTVNAVNDPPTITDSKPAAVTMSEDGSPTPFSLTLNATDADNDTITWSISGAAGHGTATASGTGPSKSIGYTPATDYNGTDSFTVQVSDGNGGTDTIVVNVTINSVNDAPVVTATGGFTSYTEDGAPLAVDSGITVTDDGANLASATVQITGNYVNGEDILAFTNQNGISGSFNAATATMTLTGSSSVANYQTALQSVTYNNTSQSPSTSNRTVSFTANDGSLGSNITTKIVTVTAVNDAPVVTAGATLNYTENQAATAIDTTITLTDVDSANMQSATIQILDNYVNGQDVLGFTNQNGITGSFNPASGTLTLAGPATKANYVTALKSVTYFNTSNDPSTAARLVTWIVDDGAAANHASTLVTSTINVTAVNDPPTATGYTSLPAQAGIPISYPAGKLGGTDVEAGTTITIVTTPDSVTGGTVVINPDGSFTFTPLPNTAGTNNTALFTYHVTDNGTPGSASSASATVSFNVAGPAIYFVKNPAVGANNCTLGNECLLATAVANIGAATNTRIFIEDANSHAGPVPLNSNGWLIGQGVKGTTFDTFFGINAPAQGTLAARPSTGQTNPTITTGGITLNSAGTANTIRGLTVSNTGANTKIVGSGFGTLTVGNTANADVILSGTGKAMDLATGAFDSSSAFISVATTSSPTHGLKIGPTVSGTVAFGSTSVSGSAAQGIYVTTSTANINFGATTIGATTAGEGLRLESNSAGTRTFASLGITSSAAQGIVHTENGTANGGGLTNVTGTTTITNPAGVGILIQKASASNGVTFANVSVSGSGGTGVVLQNNAGAVTFADLDITPANNQRGLQVTNTVNSAVGTITATSGTITTTGANAVEVVGVSTTFRQQLAMVFDSVSSTGGSNNVLLTNVSGSIDMNAGALSGSTAAAFNVSGSTATVSYDGSITNATGGISLTNNTGGIINFTGVITLDGTTAAFTATGGGTVTSTNTTSTIGGTTAATTTALNVSNTTIGAGGLKFQKISSNGGGTGIILDTTGASGGLTVNGDGANTSVGGNSTGGTISNKSGADGSTATGIGIYLNNTANVVLRRINISGSNNNFAIKGFSVNGFTLEYSTVGGTNGTAPSLVTPENYGEGSIYFGNATANGTTGSVILTNNNISGGRKRNFSLVNTTAGTTTLTVKGNTFGAIQNFADGGTSFAVEARVASGVIINTTFGGTNAGEANTLNSAVGDLVNFTGQDLTTMDVVMRNNTLSDNHAFNNSGGGGIAFATKGIMTFHVTGNTMRDANGSAVTFFKAGASAGTPSMSGFFDSNIIGVAGVAGSGSKTGNGVFVSAGGTGTMSYTITNNQIHQIAGNCHIYADNTGGSYTANFDIRGNTLDTLVAPNWFAGIAVTNGSPSSTDTINVCAKIGGSTAADKNTLNLGGQLGIIVGASGSAGGHTFNLPGYAGGASLANVQTFIQGNNTGSFTTQAYADAPATASQFTGVGTGCGTPASLLFAAENSQCDPSQPVLDTPAVAMTGTSGQASTALTQTELDRIVESAQTRWEATGMTAEQSDTLRKLKFEVADLPNVHLGETNGQRIRVSGNAGGNGWFVSATGNDDGQLDNSAGFTRSYTGSAGVPANRIDLLTVIMHEMGHALGLPDTYDANDRDKVMFGYLTTGERRVPATNDAAGSKPLTLAGPHYLSAGETPVTVGTIPAGKSVTVRFKVNINNPIPSNASPISSQGTVHSTTNSFTDVPTDDGDGALAGSADPTVTPVTIPPRAFSAGGPPPATGTVNSPYAGYTFTADGAPAPTYTVSSGTLPPGITLSSGGVLSGTPTTPGVYSNIVVRATNAAGTFDTAAFTITINQVSPSFSTQASAGGTLGTAITDQATINGTNPSGTITFKLYGPNNGTCSGSPISTSVKTVTGNNNYTSDPFTPTAVGTYNWVASYSGDANNAAVTGVCGAANESVAITQGSTTTTLGTSKSPTVFGESVTFTATVAANAPATTARTGTVQFQIDGVDAGGPVTLSGNQAQLTTSSLSVNAGHTIKATYSGDTNYTGSDNTTTQVVNKAGTTTGVTSSVNPSTFGQSVTFTATVGVTAPGAGNPTGSVQFTIDGNPVGAPVALSGNTAQLSISTLTVPGPHVVNAAYNGDGNFSGSNGNLSGGQTVNKANTGTAVSSSANPSTPGQNVTFTATVTTVSPGAGTPTGSVQFVIDGVNFGAAVALNGSGVAQTSTSTLTAAGSPHTVTAQYNGTTNFNVSSGSLSGGQTVSKISPTMTTQASPAVNTGGTITDTANLAGGSAPTGTITFKLYGPNDGACGGAVLLTSTKTVSGNGPYTSDPFTATSAGTYRWVATYSGDNNHNGVNGACNDANESVTVSKVSPSMSTQASPAVNTGGSITDTATLSGGNAPTGTITFKLYGPNDGACGGAVLLTSTRTVSGNGPYTSDPFTATSAGTYRWVATYSGDNNNNGVNGACNDANESVTVSKATPTISTQASPGINVGGTISDTATLAGGTAPTGTITFTLFGPNNSTCSGAAIFTSVVNVNGNNNYTSATFAPTTFGTYNWIATYSGDANNNAAAGVCGAANESVFVDQAPMVQWSASAYSVNENAGSVTLTITRTGNTSTNATVHYSTTNGSATSGQDYTASSGDVVFGAGETSKPVVITITDDNASEGNETFTASLSAVAGASVGTPQTTTVTIVDDEAAPTPTPTPTATPTPTPTATPTPTPTPVPTPTPAQALNLSTRMRVDIGDRAVIAGFIITGNASKDVVIRGLGPSLVNSNVPAATLLNDPYLELHGPNGSLITSNDNWVTSPQRPQFENTIFKPTDDRESVILATLPPGNYTAILTGVTQTTGIGLIEVYDNNQGADAVLANISTRGYVKKDDEVMIGGFSLGGNPNNTRIAVRGIGQSLAPYFGGNNVLSDPTLELHNANGTIMISNDDWTDDSTSAGQLATNGLALQHPKESGIFTTLPPGPFTVILAGKNGGFGIGLVEIYNVR